MPRLGSDYDPETVEASRAVLLEVMTILRSYRDALVLIGGWAPYFLLEKHGLPEAGFRHVGSIDIDLVIDPEIVDEERYATITRLLLERGYRPSPSILYQFERAVVLPGSGREYRVGVDFLTPRPPKGKGKSHRHRQVQPDLRARTLEGAEIALRHYFLHPLAGTLPEDGMTEVEFKVTDLVGCFALKGIALGERYAEKDAYDIYTLCAYHEGGPGAVAARLKPFVSDPVLARGLKAIEQRFRSLEAEGPSWVATFLGYDDPEEVVMVQRDAFMSVGEVLRQLASLDLEVSETSEVCA